LLIKRNNISEEGAKAIAEGLKNLSNIT